MSDKLTEYKKLVQRINFIKSTTGITPNVIDLPRDSFYALKQELTEFGHYDEEYGLTHSNIILPGLVICKTAL